MKTKLLFFSLFFITCISSYSQLSGGVRAGVNYTNIFGPNTKDYKFKFGWQAGGYIEYDFATHASFQAEVNYSVKGYKLKSSESMPLGTGTAVVTYHQDYNIRYNVSYIDIPLIININFGEMGSYIGVGPQVSILANANAKGEINNSYSPPQPPPFPQNTSITIDEAGRDGFAPIDFGVTFGLGSKYENGLEYCIRGGYGLTDMFDSGSSSSTYSSGSGYHNLVASVTIGYAIGQTSGSYSKDRRYKKKGKRH